MSFDEQPDAQLHGECAAEIARLEQQRDELAAQVEVMREALVSLLVAAPVHIECNNMGHAKKYQHRYDEECPLVPMYTEAMLKAQKAITLPNTAADVLRERDARVLREAAEHLESHEFVKLYHSGHYPEAVELRRMADEMEQAK